MVGIREQERPKPKVSKDAWYPLSKGGGMGTLLRDCRIIQQGLEEK